MIKGYSKNAGTEQIVDASVHYLCLKQDQD